jgi:hypothetical protein
MNDKRNGLNRLLKAIPIEQPYAVLLLTEIEWLDLGLHLLTYFVTFSVLKLFVSFSDPKQETIYSEVLDWIIVREK